MGTIRLGLLKGCSIKCIQSLLKEPISTSTCAEKKKDGRTAPYLFRIFQTYAVLKICVKYVLNFSFLFAHAPVVTVTAQVEFWVKDRFCRVSAHYVKNSRENWNDAMRTG